MGAAAVAIGVGRLVPAVTHGSQWPFRVIGIGYGLVAVAVLVIGALRQKLTADALRRGTYDELSSPVVLWLSAAAVALSIAAVALVAAQL